MEKALFSALYDVMSEAWRTVEAEAKAQDDAETASRALMPLREAA